VRKGCAAKCLRCLTHEIITLLGLGVKPPAELPSLTFNHLCFLFSQPFGGTSDEYDYAIAQP